jgi:2-polyprenyl-3-methyl-5-hydroxy-6-metoxy-1,4-benzoquinol methylase
MSLETVRHSRGTSESDALAAKIEPFDSFWEGPADIEKGYSSFGKFYKANYLIHMPEDRGSNVLVISCGPGYLVNMLNEEGYANVVGIDSFPDKVKWGQGRGLDCRCERALEFLLSRENEFDAIICEQELNHLTKDEIMRFLGLFMRCLRKGGTLIVHGLNGANPVVGSESLAQNFDHYNTFTEYTLNQILDYTGYEQIKVFPLHLYVFYKNPVNYVAWAVSSLLSLTFRGLFILYGKENRIFTKKIAAVARKPA